MVDFLSWEKTIGSRFWKFFMSGKVIWARHWRLPRQDTIDIFLPAHDSQSFLLGTKKSESWGKLRLQTGNFQPDVKTQPQRLMNDWRLTCLTSGSLLKGCDFLWEVGKWFQQIRNLLPVHSVRHRLWTTNRLKSSSSIGSWWAFICEQAHQGRVFLSHILFFFLCD